MADEGGEKTEEATQRKRQQARDKGNVPLSKDFNVAASMACVAAVLYLAGPTMAENLGRLFTTPFDQVEVTMSRDDAVTLIMALASMLGAVLVPAMAIMFAGALSANVLQVGFLWSSEALTPNVGRMNPIKNIQNILSSRALMKLVVSLGKLGVLGTLAAWSVWSMLPGFVSLTGAGPGEIASAIGQSSALLAAQMAGALFVLALADLFFQRWKHSKDLMMTKQEIRDEMKEMEGDPFIKQRRKDAHRKLAMAQELAAVPTADGILTNPTHYSIAFKYDMDTMSAPRIVAKGVDEMALRIREIARENNIPIIERAPLARRLWAEVKTGHEIPIDLYETFIEILQYIYKLRGKMPKRPAA